jgi:hypothetical protein
MIIAVNASVVVGPKMITRVTSANRTAASRHALTRSRRIVRSHTSRSSAPRGEPSTTVGGPACLEFGCPSARSATRPHQSPSVSAPRFCRAIAAMHAEEKTGGRVHSRCSGPGGRSLSHATVGASAIALKTRSPGRRRLFRAQTSSAVHLRFRLAVLAIPDGARHTDAGGSFPRAPRRPIAARGDAHRP